LVYGKHLPPADARFLREMNKGQTRQGCIEPGTMVEPKAGPAVIPAVPVSQSCNCVDGATLGDCPVHDSDDCPTRDELDEATVEAMRSSDEPKAREWWVVWDAELRAVEDCFEERPETWSRRCELVRVREVGSSKEPKV
jgi:hypothetical protein